MPKVRGTEERVHLSNTKDTKKWCRGKAGVPHIFEWVHQFTLTRSRTGNTYVMEKQVCSNCGRVGKWRTVDNKETTK
jgi:hypothetical protein